VTVLLIVFYMELKAAHFHCGFPRTFKKSRSIRICNNLCSEV
jgi:hypothetical protein